MLSDAVGNYVIGAASADNTQGWNKVFQVNGDEHAKLLVTNNGGVKLGMFAHTSTAKIGTESNHDLTFTAGYWNDIMTLTTAGNVGIGTATPAEKLSVNGKIRAKEIKVEANNWPDYVFEPEHKPLTLKEIEAYIKANKHLPEIPSAREVENNGLELGEMNKLLLKKVEELTLYILELKKENDKIKQKLKID